MNGNLILGLVARLMLSEYEYWHLSGEEFYYWERIDMIVCVILVIIALALYFWLIFNAEKLNKKQKDKKRKKAFEELKARHPEWAQELDPNKEQEKKDREEFERLAKEHPEWL